MRNTYLRSEADVIQSLCEAIIFLLEKIDIQQIDQNNKE